MIVQWLDLMILAVFSHPSWFCHFIIWYKHNCLFRCWRSAVLKVFCCLAPESTIFFYNKFCCLAAESTSQCSNIQLQGFLHLLWGLRQKGSDRDAWRYPNFISDCSPDQGSRSITFGIDDKPGLNALLPVSAWSPLLAPELCWHKN